ncbi:hypothetical protein JX266_006227 [Neoarthrinium moseri]|nr:hypothetical protein JX266_006227 [Neoarthrinium moseri]
MRCFLYAAAGFALATPALGNSTSWVWQDNPSSVLKDPEYHAGPSGAEMDLDRAHIGPVLYGGAGVWQCANRGHIALTFDDGPSNFTANIARAFEKENMRVTFFMTGYNLGRKIDSGPWPALIRKLDKAGHQIGSHSWIHKNFGKVSAKEIEDEMRFNEKAFMKIFKKVPRYMRPPFAICPKACAEVMENLGYHIIQFNLDSLDYKHQKKGLIQKSINKIDKQMGPNGTGSYIVLNHDIHELTATSLVPAVIKFVKQRGYKAVTVGECLNDPKVNWYRDEWGGVYE